MGIPAYAELVRINIGKKLNIDLLGNSFGKSFNLTQIGQDLCARAFVSSLKFAGFIGPDGTLAIPNGGAIVQLSTTPPPPKVDPQDDLPDEDSQSQTLYLDSKRKRKITIKAPFTVTKEELERIRAWIGIQLLVQEAETTPPPQAQ